MKMLKCDICGYFQEPKNNSGYISIEDANRDDFYELYHDKIKYDLCNSCFNKYKQLKHDLTEAFIFYPDREIEINISNKEAST